MKVGSNPFGGSPVSSYASCKRIREDIPCSQASQTCGDYVSPQKSYQIIINFSFLK